jgi:hypothetical protein
MIKLQFNRFAGQDGVNGDWQQQRAQRVSAWYMLTHQTRRPLQRRVVTAARLQLIKLQCSAGQGEGRQSQHLCLAIATRATWLLQHVITTARLQLIKLQRIATDCKTRQDKVSPGV